MTLEQVGGALALAMSLGGLLGGAGYWFVTHRSREANATVEAKGLRDNNALLKEQNALLRENHDDAKAKLLTLEAAALERERQLQELKATVRVLDERVTSRAAVDELAAAIASFAAGIRESQTALQRDLAAIQRSTAEWQAAEARERAQGREASAQEHKALADVLERIVAALPAKAA